MQSIEREIDLMSHASGGYALTVHQLGAIEQVLNRLEVTGYRVDI
jgi:hypothetical protein